ncbi:MAG: DNA-binding response regulator [Deltaproteobacteria bacterium CG_4_10_14_0_2_um_filter_43_8]|nr:MAG: DNA-binding response regulator [Deltaproteobacteria bacterium CG11_big_fil_rev_8_21_14_0_20_42_23]PJA21040.1 MAG: DNA-binding response regulator [Deltaproteobacteria bacterium CG_4_10_14_0_2_um_filter_43_8]PJC64320.1 MAG: DNA-binding response regulator [Deltaproteobacteria bacterium CG_4_9_14_0_2_um_filter_42_21]
MLKSTNLLIVDDDQSMTRVFEKIAQEMKLTFEVAKDGNEAVRLLGEKQFEVSLTDIMLPGFSGEQILDYIKKNNIKTEVILVTGVGSIESAVSAIKKGAYDYLTKPFDDVARVKLLIEKALERHRLVQRVYELELQHTHTEKFEEIVGKSQNIREVFATIDALSGTSSTVLIQGASGTGKELVARAIHARSIRKTKPFVVINSGAIPENLLESELFGHVKGAFTGSVSDHMGLFEEAHGGTIFLDEIGDLPLSLQVKILRVLQEGELRRVGDVHIRKVDVRIIAATHKDLMLLVKNGQFREDLYYRLNVINIGLPLLKERLEDIPLLAYHFLNKYREKVKKDVQQISIDAMQALQAYSWPGNIRELENVIERAVVLCSSDTVSMQELPSKLLGESCYLVAGAADADLAQFNYKDAKNRAMHAFNKAYIGKLLKANRGNITNASSMAGMDRSNFKKLIKKYEIDARSFKSKGELRDV